MTRSSPPPPPGGRPQNRVSVPVLNVPVMAVPKPFLIAASGV